MVIRADRFACSLFLFLLAALLPHAGTATPAATGAPGIGAAFGYALLVGSNRPGPGQQELRFAGEDAQRVESVLTELGGYLPERVTLLRDPDAAALRRALESMAGRLAAHQRRGEPTVFLYYYSGHARAQALSLGPEEVPLAELKRRMEELPATVRLAVLDACQSGAISGVKGVGPAAEFSASSVAGLATAGMAVMASSTGTELSQESERLGGSFFTHHLVVGLRGAADADADGQVTLSEAYRYAYDRTLVSTAGTSIGRQHVTLETDLRGRGEMVLTSPSRGGASLELPGPMLAEVLVHRQPGQTVMAEVQKVAGEPVRLALPPGGYAAIVRRGERVEQCELTLPPGQTVALTLTGCRELPPEESVPKGGGAARHREGLAIELSAGALFGPGSSPFTETLGHFGYEDERPFDFTPQLALSVVHGLLPHLSLVLEGGSLDHGRYAQSLKKLGGEEHRREFTWTAYRLGLAVRGSVALLSGWLVPFVQAGGGVALGRTTLGASAGTPADDQSFWGYSLAAATGLQLMPWRHLGIFAQGEWVRAPVIENREGEAHDSGGLALRLGVRGAF